MEFITAVSDAYHGAGPDDILIAAQNLYNTLKPETIPQVLAHLHSLTRSEFTPQGDFPIGKQQESEQVESTRERGGGEGDDSRSSNFQNKEREEREERGDGGREGGGTGLEGTVVGSLEGAVSFVGEVGKSLEGADARKAAINLILLEIKLYFTQTDCSQELKALAFLSPASANPFSALLRIKYQDLLTDYQFLLAPHTKYLRLMDMVPKKINALAGATGSNSVVDNVQMKVLVYYLLGDSDFRDKSVLKYLMSERVLSRYGNTPISGFMAYKERLVPYESFCALVQYVSQFYSFRRVFELFSVSLTENYLDSNLSKLPRYYTNVTLARIHSLFIHDPSNVDVEAVVARMIINNKLPAGTHIDQIRAVVCFGHSENYDAFNTHVKRICDAVESLSTIT